MKNSVILVARALHKTSRQLSSVSDTAAAVQQRTITSLATNQRSRLTFRTSDNDPSQHTLDHVGLNYNISNEDLTTTLRGALKPQHYRMMKTFNENCMMVRQPALEVNGYLKNLNHNHPIPRFLYYGNHGSGKTSCMALNLHFCARNDWVVVHVPWAGRWMRVNEWHPKKEALDSSFKPGRWDVADDAVEFLTHFKMQNQRILKALDLKTTQEYVWTKREKAEIGTPLDDVLNFGLNRFKFATDVVGVLLKELREQTQSKGFKVLVAIGGISSLFIPWNAENTIKAENKKLHPSQLTMVHNFKKMLSPTWSGGAVVGIVNDVDTFRKQRETILPKYLLERAGFEHLDPFVPMHVPDYTEREARSMIEYYIDRNWIHNEYGHTEKGIKEIMFVSNKNGFGLTKTVAGM